MVSRPNDDGPQAGAQDEVIAFLSGAGTLGAGSPEIVETHGSMVFLAGARAYKLKRSVRYSYLDYSTPERRRAACEAELRINGGFAPALYVAVEPVVRRGDGGLGLGGPGEAVDWLVVMNRFDPAAQLDRMAERGALSPELMLALADEIAGQHGRAERSVEYGGSAGLDGALSSTIANLRLEAGAALPAASVEAWATRAEGAARALAALLERRRLGGKVRACHGDLHLRNICVLEGRPTLFDAIEFDPGLSSIDVLYDLAFLLMDLHARKLDGLGNLVLNRYLDQSDEVDGLAALPLFLSLRAAIRALVSATSSRVASVAGSGAAEEAGSYLALALELLEPVEPCVVAIGGLSGTGKSTLAYRLAPQLGRCPGARVLRSDVLRKRLAGVAATARLPVSSYTAEARRGVYQAMLLEAGRCLDAGQAVICDAVFDEPGMQVSMAALARARGMRFRGIWLTAPLGVLRRRVSERRQDASDATVAIVEAQAERGLAAPPGWREIDASGGIEGILRAVDLG